MPSSGLSLLLLLWDQLEQQGTCKGAKRRKSDSKMQRVGGNAEENAPTALCEKWPELFHMGITPMEEPPRG